MCIHIITVAYNVVNRGGVTKRYTLVFSTDFIYFLKTKLDDFEY